MALFHHAGLAMASYAHDYLISRCHHNRMRSTHIASVGSHHRQVVLMDYLLHLLHAAEVSEHVADRHDIAIVDEGLGDSFGGFDGSCTDRLDLLARSSNLVQSYYSPSQRSKQSWGSI